MHRFSLKRGLAGVALVMLAVAASDASVAAQPADRPPRPDPVVVPGLPFAVPVPPQLPPGRGGEAVAATPVPIAETVLGWNPPLPPRRPGAAGEAPRQTPREDEMPEIAAVEPATDGRPFTPPLPPARPVDAQTGRGHEDDEAASGRRITRPPPPPEIATPQTPGDPGWILRNRPDREAGQDGEPALDAPGPAVGGVAMVDRPAVVEERPMEPREPPPGDDGGESEIAAVDEPAGRVPLAVEPWEGERARVLFDGADTAFGPAVQTMLDRIAARLRRDEDLRLTVLSYAGGEPEAAGRARLLSLTRALAVRDYLTDRDVRQARIAVRGLGDSAGQGPPDRIDLLLGP